ncbi:uncharacterized protein PAN0_003d1789 [Moesziomyces antarcticus]|uniref:Uncharacterized protein n=1 Tax=Pseudozyma antarctica TaxID=84753 RepID=A0A5C3FK73_PSEA2|nr:uncharacterized protein PAN0_003d1789 [Moesziomyces antarcticus]GAK63584.1 conserved hypothetical protein [Moesziomyces antarcticus]SPO44175.1 uncharacterized protein PSANT_01860 [Moesziomyces antarcticus]
MAVGRWLSGGGPRSGSSKTPRPHQLDSGSPSDVLWEQLEARRPAPLRFVLHLSRRPNGSLCPCLEVNLPSTSSSTPHHTVSRILDPEHRVPYITLCPILAAAGLTILQGLLRFGLTPTAYDVSLAGLEPWDDLWISLPLARSIAAELGLLHNLAAILDPTTSLAWSLDEFGEGLSHNWRVPQTVVDAASYSTDAITRPDLGFGNVLMLPKGQQIKTLVSAELRATIFGKAEVRRKQPSFQLHQKLVQWSTQLHSIWLDFSSLLEQGIGEDDEQRALMLRELQQEVAPPTSTDVLEWTQLVSSPMTGLGSPAQPEDAEVLLEPLSLADVSALRPTNPPLGFGVAPSHEDADKQVVLRHLQAVLRGKLAMLQQMSLLTLGPFACAPDLDLAQDTVERGEPSSVSSERERVRQHESQPTAAQLTELANASDIAALNAKVDGLAVKLDRWLESHDMAEPAKAATTGPNSNGKADSGSTRDTSRPAPSPTSTLQLPPWRLLVPFSIVWVLCAIKVLFV